MPVIRTKPTPEETRITRAIQALESGSVKSVAAAYRVYNVPYQKLLGRYNRGTSASHGGQNKALNKAQEEALLQYIDRSIF